MNWLLQLGKPDGNEGAGQGRAGQSWSPTPPTPQEASHEVQTQPQAKWSVWMAWGPQRMQNLPSHPILVHQFCLIPYSSCRDFSIMSLYSCLSPFLYSAAEENNEAFCGLMRHDHQDVRFRGKSQAQNSVCKMVENRIYM